MVLSFKFQVPSPCVGIAFLSALSRQEAAPDNSNLLSRDPHQLKPKSISSFAELSKLFLTQFFSGKKSRKPTAHLFTLKQGNKETLKDFIVRFNEEALLVEDYDDKMTLSTMFNGLRERKFTLSTGKNPPITLAELISRAHKYTNAKKFSNFHRTVQVAEQSSKEKRLRNEEPQSSNKKLDDRASRDCRPSRRLESKFHSNTSPEHILLDIRSQKLLNWRVWMKIDAENRDKREYYQFHHDHGHNISDYMDLKDEIKVLICKGHLRRYTKQERSAWREEQPSKPAKELAEICTIYDGSYGGGDSNKAHKPTPGVQTPSTTSTWPKSRGKNFGSAPAA
ncbi:uncharacterized protein LOC131241468 [Magnolia sinica]|uniref:uncharacterized protein LOC131241468 n=1 Tax=Magnolia sinica TaxID=86752 RepID=UPI0026587CA9|nr:uncharacterized protein LOC131241468 [Magnolia sinica]